MKICYLADGESLHTIRWCRHFKKLGHEVHLISFKDVAIDGIYVHYIDAGKIKRSGGNWRVVLKYRRIRSLIQRIKPDILHAHYATGYGLVGALSNFHPFVLTTYGTDILISPSQSLLYKLIIKFSLKKADWITSMSIQITEAITSLGVKKDKITEVVFGIDDKIFNHINRKLPADKFIITSTRHFEQVYNLPLLFHAIQIIKQKIPGLVVNMVSDGTLREELKAMAIKLDIKDNVIFKGKLQLSQFVEILNQTHLYVTLAFSDGNSVSLTEAMACGAFSIASDIPANRQWISDGVNGFLVPVDDPDSLAQKILYVYENYNKLEVNCHHYNDNIINEKGLWFKNMEKVQQKYESLVKN